MSLKPSLYLIKVNDDKFRYNYLTDEISLKVLKSKFSLGIFLNDSDITMIRNCGGSIAYRDSSNTWYWIINLNHIEIDYFSNTELSNKIFKMIERVKRDIKISELL